ncbi:hypothetical protein [Dactylosporangium darangshiense]|uniref:DUF5667 domain-containing protein n=1 Tax=Dactylosporangium darangshiense TaxID=579108 RepID=A0ABP8DW48_9ACTN
MIDDSPHDGTDDEVIALDLALDAVARRDYRDADPVVAALAGFAQEIDGQATALTRRRRLPALRPSHAGSAKPTAATASAPRRPRAARASRPGRGRRRLLAIPLLACLALAVAVPLSNTPDAPLYPLHRMLFEQGQPSPADSARLHLANARQALGRVAASSGPARAAALDDARRNLTEARDLIPHITDTPTRLQLDAELASLDQRATQLAGEDQQDNPSAPSQQNNQSGQNNQNGQNGQNGGVGTNGPQDDSQNGDQGGSGQSGSVPNGNQHGR